MIITTYSDLPNQKIWKWIYLVYNSLYKLQMTYNKTIWAQAIVAVYLINLVVGSSSSLGNEVVLHAHPRSQPRLAGERHFAAR